MPAISSVKVIINAHSGLTDKEEVRRGLSEVFEAGGVTADITIAKGGEIARLARQAAHENWTVIAAGGGDGTVRTVAAAIVGSDKILGVLPLGTLNHFAKDLKIPLELEGAAATLMSGRIAKVDVGEVNGHIFINNSSLGLYPTIVSERERRQRLGLRKWPAFLWAAVAALRLYPFLHVHLVAGGKKFNLRTPFVFVGNNEYEMERLNIGTRERLDEGVLSLYVTNRTSRWGLVRLALRALVGRLRQEKDFMALLTNEAKIETRHSRLRAAFDGEVETMRAPLLYRSRPGALQVMAPADESK